MILRRSTGDRIDFTLTENGEVLLRPLIRRDDDLFGRLHKPGRQPLSPEAMDNASPAPHAGA